MRRAVKHFIEAYDRVEYFCLHKETVLRSFELAEELKHDVYDCVYVAALQEKASAIITTDRDFEKL